jgi:hypothetical protein
MIGSYNYTFICGNEKCTKGQCLIIVHLFCFVHRKEDGQLSLPGTDDEERTELF